MRHRSPEATIPRNGATQAPLRSFKSFYFDSGVGYFAYYSLPNQFVWSLLSEDEKQFVVEQNKFWNNASPGYANPERYQGQGGLNYQSNQSRTAFWEGRQLEQFLTDKRPVRVIEVGPGSGFFTRSIIESQSVKEYCAVDINPGFLEYIQAAIENSETAKHISLSFVESQKLPLRHSQVDAIVIFSALHHIPDRLAFMQVLARLLRPNGFLFFYEPIHSLARVIELCASFTRNGWWLRNHVLKRNNYMTHHFLTRSEVAHIAKASGMVIDGIEIKNGIPAILACIAGRAMAVTLRKR